MEQYKNLTESMFYVLMALYEKETFGTEIVDTIQEISGGRVPMGPGTLYTILSKFEKDGLIIETAVEGRKRTYRITDYGRLIYDEELRRLKEVLETGMIMRGRYHEN